MFGFAGGSGLDPVSRHGLPRFCGPSCRGMGRGRGALRGSSACCRGRWSTASPACLTRAGHREAT